MPTGYTHIVDEGCSFKEYALYCARVLSPVVSSFHLRVVKKLEKELERAERRTDEEWEKLAVSEYKKRKKAYDDVRKRNRLVRGRRQEMRKLVFEWELPSDDFRELRSFMIQSLYNGSPEEVEVAPARRCSGVAFKRREIKRIKNSIAINKRLYMEEVERAEKSARLVKALKASL